MTEKNERAAPFACAEIAIEEPGLVRLRLFNGKELEINLKPYRLDVKAGGDLLIKLLSDSMQDVMILANLQPVRPAKPSAWGCKNAVHPHDAHFHPST